MGVNSRDMMGYCLVGGREIDVKESAGAKEGGYWERMRIVRD